VEREAGEEAGMPCDTGLSALSGGNAAKNHRLGKGSVSREHTAAGSATRDERTDEEDGFFEHPVMPKRFLLWRDTEQQLMTSITDQLGERRY